MKKKIYFDTNIFIYFVEVYDKNEKSFLERIMRANEIITSELTIAECLVKKAVQPPLPLHTVRMLEASK